MEQYHDWTVVNKELRKRGNRKSTMYLCRCKCGAETWHDLHTLKSGRTKRCDTCARMAKRRWYTGHRLYGIWRDMLQRCNNPKNKYFSNYGGRGIKTCGNWKNSAEKFITWALANGWEEGLQLDRKDNDGDYCVDNCRFISQQKNLRNSRVMKSNNTSGYRGVVILKQKTGIKYKSEFTFMSVVHRLGHYDTAEEAAKVRDEFIVRFRIPAPLNFPRDDYKPDDIESEFEKFGVDMIAVAKEISSRKKPRKTNRYGVLKIWNKFSYSIPSYLSKTGKRFRPLFSTEEEAAASRNKMIDDYNLKLRRS